MLSIGGHDLLLDARKTSHGTILDDIRKRLVHSPDVTIDIVMVRSGIGVDVTGANLTRIRNQSFILLDGLGYDPVSRRVVSL